MADQQFLPFLDVQAPEPVFEAELQQAEWGTFKDSLRAPIHSWFTYPAGFSYKAVEASFKAHQIGRGQTVYDPFMGSGTTNLTAQKHAIHSYGVEAHPFVFTIAQTKMNWNIVRQVVVDGLAAIDADVLEAKKQVTQPIADVVQQAFPKLLLTCYPDETLWELLLIRNALNHQAFDAATYHFFFVGLTGLLRQVSSAATGWPYIAPRKKKTTSVNKLPLLEFRKFVYKMLEDVRLTIAEADPDYAQSVHHLLNGDSRNTHGIIPDEAIDHVFTSPPYLNNFDYADRTRLELYFFGQAATWGEITQNIRSKLITSATTQIVRSDQQYVLSKELMKNCPEVAGYLQYAIKELGAIRLQKGGKKSYDLLVTGYFNDMYLIIQDVFRVLKPGRKAVFVLGDSAPYGVHIPTDEFIGKIGVDIGFSDYQITMLRERGGKWEHNPQRHNVKLKESIVTLSKGK